MKTHKKINSKKTKPIKLRKVIRNKKTVHGKKTKRRKTRQNPIDPVSLKRGMKVFVKEDPYIFSKLTLGGAEIIKNKKSIIVPVSDLSFNPQKTIPDLFKSKFGFSKLNEPVYDQLNFYSISGKENIKLRNAKLILDFVIFRKVNGDKEPIPGMKWNYRIYLQDENDKLKVAPVTSSAEYDEKTMPLMPLKEL